MPITSNKASKLAHTKVGTWSPILEGNTTAGSPTYSTQWGVYMVQDRLVHLNGRVILSSKGGAVGPINITGLPYVVDNSHYSQTQHHTVVVSFINGAALAAGTGPISGLLTGNTNKIRLYNNKTDGTSVSSLTDTEITNTFDIIFSVTYLRV